MKCKNGIRIGKIIIWRWCKTRDNAFNLFEFEIERENRGLKEIER